MNPFHAGLVAVLACVPQPSTAVCCACGPSARDHNEVRDVLLDYPRLADGTAEPEVLGLIATVDFRNFIVFFWAETLAH